MKFHTALAGSALTLAMALSGCASDGSVALSTGSIIEDTKQAKAQRVDPACVSLMARIDELRKEGTPERIAKVATGKSKTASVKREALARMTELDKANSEFQQKCSTLAAPKAKPASPAAKAAAAAAATPNTPAPTPSTQTTAAQAAAPTAAAKTAAAKKAATELKQAAATVKKPDVAVPTKTATAVQ